MITRRCEMVVDSGYIKNNVILYSILDDCW